MKKFEKMKYHWGDLLDLIRGDTKSFIFSTSIKMKIFDYLESPVGSKELALQINSHERNTELFLNTLAGLDMITKKNRMFQNTEKTSIYLVSNSDNYLGNFFLHYQKWGELLKPNMESLIKKGPPQNENHKENYEKASSGELWAKSAKLTAVYQYTGIAQLISNILASQPEFNSMKKLLDLGGGSGFFTQAIVASHPSMSGIIFEQPAVAKVAGEFIKKFEAEKRINVMGGDYLNDPIGDSYDLVFASSTLNFAKGSLDTLLKKIYKSMNPGGVFMTLQDGIHSERTKPLSHVIGFLSLELFGADFAIEKGEIAKIMLEIGFKSVHSFTISTEFGEMDIDIARK